MYTHTNYGYISNRTWKYEEGYLSSDESTTDPEDIDLDDIDTSSASVSRHLMCVESSYLSDSIGASISAQCWSQETIC